MAKKPHPKHAEKPVEPEEPVAADWPAPVVATGDEPRVERIVTDVQLLTDVGSLTHVLAAVFRHAKRQHVRPDVIRELFKTYSGD